MKRDHDKRPVWLHDASEYLALAVKYEAMRRFDRARQYRELARDVWEQGL